jgi:hypothetical protein
MAEVPSEQKNVEQGMSHVEVEGGSPPVGLAVRTELIGSFFLRSFLFDNLRSVSWYRSDHRLLSGAFLEPSVLWWLPD